MGSPPAAKVNLYDGQSVKGALDAGATAVLEGAAGGRGLDMGLSNLRLMLTGLGTGLALVAQFWPPRTYPGNWWALAVCCPLFVLVNALVTYWLPSREQDIVAVTRASPPLVLRSQLDTHNHLYRLSTKPNVWKSAPLGSLFTKDGTLRTQVLEDFVKSVLV